MVRGVTKFIDEQGRGEPAKRAATSKTLRAIRIDLIKHKQAHMMTTLTEEEELGREQQEAASGRLREYQWLYSSSAVGHRVLLASTRLPKP